MIYMERSIGNKNYNRARCEEITWNGSTCKRPAEWLTEKNDLLCCFHGASCNHTEEIWRLESGEMPPKGLIITNTEENPFVR